MRRSRRIAVALAVLCGLLFAGGAVSATAATGDVTWSGSIATAAGTSTRTTVVWNARTRYLRMWITTGTLAAGSCVTTYFDWSSNGHHDARALRDCRSNDAVSYSFADSSPSNILKGPNKLGICYGTADKRGVCARAYGLVTPMMNWTPWPNLTRTTPCDLTWVRRNTDGTTSSYVDLHSQRSGLVSAHAC